MRGRAAQQHRAGGEREHLRHGSRVPEAGRRRIPLRGGGQHDRHARALALVARERDRAAVLLDECARDC